MYQESDFTEEEIRKARVDAVNSIGKHIQVVSALLYNFRNRLEDRGKYHDMSKFSEEELGPLTLMQAVINKHGTAPYGSEEYKKRTAILGPMLDHHYKNNSHHPEHHDAGIAGMDLIDLVEMFCDWIAASERNGEYEVNISYSEERFGISPQLAAILRNTAKNLGYAYK